MHNLDLTTFKVYSEGGIIWLFIWKNLINFSHNFAGLSAS